MTVASLDRPQTKAWDAKSVRDALTLAFRVLNAIEGRPGHRRLKASWPEYVLDYPRESQNWVRFAPRSWQISQMEQALLGATLADGRKMQGWLNGGVMKMPDYRGKLIMSCMASARGVSGRSLCERHGWAEATFRLHRDAAANIIARELNEAGVERW